MLVAAVAAPVEMRVIAASADAPFDVLLLEMAAYLQPTNIGPAT